MNVHQLKNLLSTMPDDLDIYAQDQHGVVREMTTNATISVGSNEALINRSLVFHLGEEPPFDILKEEGCY